MKQDRLFRQPVKTIKEIVQDRLHGFKWRQQARDAKRARRRTPKAAEQKISTPTLFDLEESEMEPEEAQL